ncbi:DUF4129 domain-containing protein [Trueperella pyogenes]|uniref:DUF4129 domain-containing protein n=1 Tax=Trueperella pyogenes TaxID=1661 RepID=UPI00345DE435
MPVFLPDSETARQLAEDELSKAMYDHAPNLFQRFLEWLFTRIDIVVSHLSPGDGGAGNIAVIVAIGVLVVVIIAIAIRHARSTSARFARGRTQLFDDNRTSTALFAAAKRAELAADLNLAAIERFRAIIRLLDERKTIDVVPGMTALEAARAGSARLGHEELFLACAQLFNDVYYWHGQATEDDVQRTYLLHHAVSDTKVAPR